MVIEVAATLAKINAPIVSAGSAPASAAVMVVYPTPYTCGSWVAITPTRAPPIAARRYSGTGTFSNRLSE